MARIEQEENGKKGRFIIYDNDNFAGELTYIWDDETKFIVDHVGVESGSTGKAMASNWLCGLWNLQEKESENRTCLSVCQSIV